MSELEDIGGEDALRAIIDEFVDSCFDDLMIGFLFRHAKRERVKRFEFQHAARHLGGSIEYSGRTIRDAHRAHPILGGHFDRRLTLLRQTLDRHGVAESIRDRWIAHHQSLRAEVTRDPDSRCNHEAAEAKIAEGRDA